MVERNADGTIKAGTGSLNPGGKPGQGYLKYYKRVFTPELLSLLKLINIVGLDINEGIGKELQKVSNDKKFKSTWGRIVKNNDWDEINPTSKSDIQKMIKDIEDRIIGPIVQKQQIESDNVNHNFDTDVKIEFISSQDEDDDEDPTIE